MLLELCQARHDLPLRIIVTTRQRPPEVPGILQMVEVPSATREEMIELLQIYRITDEAAEGDR